MRLQHFGMASATLSQLSLQEVAHKAYPPAQVMTWLGFQFDTESVMVTNTEEKLRYTLSMVEEWSRKIRADIHKLRSLLGHLFHMVQCSHPARLFFNCMLATLWFVEYLPCTNTVYIIDEGHQEPVHIFVDACTSGTGALCQAEVYHTQFPPS